jgi:hypothetical protein
LTPGDIEKIDPGPIWRVDISSEALRCSNCSLRTVEE